MSMPTIPSSGNKSWWARPENRTTAIFIAIMGVGAFMLWGTIVPFVLTALDDTWSAMKVGALIVASLWLVTSKRVHKIARVINRWITGWFVSLDPIGIREDRYWVSLIFMPLDKFLDAKNRQDPANAGDLVPRDVVTGGVPC